MAIDVKVSDGVDSSISTKLLAIANAADNAQKSIDKLVKSIGGIDASKIKALSKAAYDSSKLDVNNARTSYYNAKEKVELAKLRTEQAKTAQADASRYHQFAVNSQALATKKSLDAEKVAQQRLATAEKSAKVATANAEAMVKQAAANVKAQYQNQLLQYTGNWAHQDNQQRNLKTQMGQAQLGVVQGRQDEILSRTLLNQQKLNTEVARGAKESANAAVSQQRLATETQRTATAATNSAIAQQRLTGATAAAQSATARAAASIATAQQRMSGLGSSSRSASGGIVQLSSAMSQLDTSASFLRSDGLRWAKVLWALSGATLTAGAIVQAADAYTLLQNRLSVVADTQADVNHLTDEMFKLAERTRQPVADVTKAFTRFDMAMKEMGRSQKDTLVVTETVGKALQMSGATAGESASAMLQLSQAFNKGKLDGDEFRSVMENAPLIANALAKELGVTRGELLKLAPAGKLTVEQLTNAITNAAPKINELFNNFKWTIGQSFTYLRNEMTEFFGSLDKTVGFTQGLSAAIRAVADNLDTLLFVVLAVTPALALFVGAKTLSGFGTLIGFLAKTSTAIGAIRSPITVVSVGLANMMRQGVATGATLSAMFATPTARAVGFQMAVVRSTAAVLALGAAAGRAGAMMMAAFSFGNIFLVIGTLVAAAIAFGDKIEMAGEKSFTMRDYVIAAFGEIWDFTKFVFESVYDFIASMFGASAQEGMTFGEKVLATFENIVMFGAAMVDSLQQIFKVLWKVFRLAVASVADGIQALVYVVVNAIIGTVNTAIGVLNGLGSFANMILTATGADAIVGTFGKIGTFAGMEFKSNIQAELASDWSMDTDVMDGAANYLSRVKERASERNKANRAEGTTRGYDADQAAKFAAANKEKEKKKKEKKPKKSAEERRAEIIEKAMNAEQKAIDVARQYGDERERVNAIETLNNKLKEKGYAELSNPEKNALIALVDQRLAAERVGKALQSMYEEVTNPQKEFKAGQEAIAILLRDGVITAERSVNMNDRLADSYASATDKLYDMNKAMKDQQAIQGKFGAAGEVAANIKAAEESARSRGLAELTPDEVSKIEEMTRKLYEMRKEQEASQQVWQDTYGAQEDIGFRIDAISKAYSDGSMAVATYTRELAALKAQQAAIDENMTGEFSIFDSMRRGLWQLVAEMPTAGQAMADALQTTLGSAIDEISSLTTDMLFDFQGMAQSLADELNRPVSSLDVLKHALGEVAMMIGKELVSALIKMGIQWAITTALGKTLEAGAAAATVATQAATASAVNAFWAPAAISASIATLGGASATGLTGFIAAQTAGKAYSALPAFKDGGEIYGAGTGRSDSIIARLSAGEHVVNAEAAERNRPILNAMNRGIDVGMGGGTQNNVNINIAVNVNSDGSVSTSTDSQHALVPVLTEKMKEVATLTVLGMMKQGQPLYNGGRK